MPSHIQPESPQVNSTQGDVRPRRATVRACMACKRPEVRVPLAPRLPRSKACCDLQGRSLSACNPAISRSLISLCGSKLLQVRRLLHSRRCGCVTAMALEQPNWQPLGTRSGSSPSSGDLLARQCVATFGASEGSSESVDGETERQLFARLDNCRSTIRERRSFRYGSPGLMRLTP